MHWKATPKPIPENGQTRTKTRFAFVPVRIENSVYWLERYVELWGYVVQPVEMLVDGSPAFAYLGEWKLISVKPLNWIPE